MSNAQTQKYLAPIVILIAILLLWELTVAAFDIQQFLLPKPSAILSNLIRVVIISPDKPSQEVSDIQAQLRMSQFTVTIPQDTPEKILKELQEAQITQFSFAEDRIMLIQGSNLNPIIKASLFTFKEAIGGFIIGCTLGILVAFITAHWTATREALMPFAIAANSMPIIAFAPIMNNWFGIDNPFSKMAIVTIMIFFPMMINTVRGLTLVDTRSLELMRSYAASEIEILLKLRVPNALPHIFNGFKIASALSMIGAIVGEYFGGPRISLGVFITQEAALFRFSSAWSAIIIACLMGISLYVLIITIERIVMPWHVSFR